MNGQSWPAEAGSQAPGIGLCATLACLWEATAAKPGNVYRGADFEDLTYADFVTSAALIGPEIGKVREQGVGRTIHLAVAATRAAVATNTNLGMLLLIAPLAAVPTESNLKDGIANVLNALDRHDTAEVYAAIRLAQPGGLGQVDEADVTAQQVPELPLLEVMGLAQNRDLVARQYVNGFAQVFTTADRIQAALQKEKCLSDAIVWAYLQQLAEWPDSLIARKRGEPVARRVSDQAAEVLTQANCGNAAYAAALRDFDFSLRTDGHQLNPGTSADLVAAGLFVLLREKQIQWPIQFYRPLESSE